MRRYFLILPFNLVTIFTFLYGQLPPDFNDELVMDEWNAAVGIEFIDTNLWYVWQRNGEIWIVENEKKLEIPLLDIRAEVGNWGDHGLLSMAIHPDFKENGFIYLAYIVDEHYLRFFGTNNYDPSLVDKYNATIGRITRYQVDTRDYKSIIPNSRFIILGEGIGSGIPVLAPAHGIGGLDFGTDGTLLIGTGDGTTWVRDHTGGEDYKEFGFDSIAKIEGFITPAEDVGSYRSQMIESLNGKILRVDPISGDGIPSNPFYDSLAPHATQSKVWALGIRSPYRIRVRPQSGSQNPDDGNPGKIYFGDVGSNQYEELNIAQGPARNFGWPSFEGVVRNVKFYQQEKINIQAPNPLFGTNGCDIEFLRFDDLIIAPRRDHQAFWKNPCNAFIEISEDIQRFVHEPPTVAWGNRINHPEETYIPGFDGNGMLVPIEISAGNSPIRSNPFDGISSIAGDFVQGAFFPEKYQNVYFHGDYVGWIRGFSYDVHDVDEIHEIFHFYEDKGPVVHMNFNQFDGCLYYVVLDYRYEPFPQEIRRICFSGNPKPVAIIEADHQFGPSPLEVKFSASKSYDPKGDPISYTWDFGNQIKTNTSDTIIIFTAPGSAPYNETVTLSVMDSAGKVDVDDLVISLNNTPPEVKIISITDGEKYTLSSDIIQYDLIADVTDTEHADDALSYVWSIKLNHNEHTHLEFTDTNKISDVTLFALDNTALDKHAYTITLSVTDAHGLVGRDAVTVFPDLQTGATYPIDDQNFWIYPNPARETIYLGIREGKAIGKNNSLLICNALGQKMHTQNLPDFNTQIDIPISTERLEQGIYFIYLFQDRKVIFQDKLLKF